MWSDEARKAALQARVHNAKRDLHSAWSENHLDKDQVAATIHNKAAKTYEKAISHYETGNNIRAKIALKNANKLSTKAEKATIAVRPGYASGLGRG